MPKKSDKAFYELLADKYEDNILKHKDDVFKFISKYVGDAINILSTRGPEKKLFFSRNLGNDFVKLVKMDLQDIKTASDTSTVHQGQMKYYSSEPMVICSIICIYVYIKNNTKVNKNKIELAPLVNLLLTLKFYSRSQKRSFKYNPNPDIMDYTIDHLSNRYNIRKFNTIFETLKNIADTHYANFQKKIMSEEDEGLKYYITNLDTRVRSLVKNIATEFYKNQEKGLGTTVDAQMLKDGEGEKYLSNVSNISADIDTVVRKIHIRMVSSTTPDISLLKRAVNKVNYSPKDKKKNEVSVSKMTIILTSIMDADEPLLYDLIKEMISYFLMEKTGRNITQLKSRDFLDTMFKTYGVSNTKNPTVLKIKSILDEILNIHAEEFLKTSRVSTIMSYMRNCIYTYMVLYIAKYSQ